MATELRIEKLNNLLKEELSKIIVRDMDFPADTLVTITRVDISPNVKYAAVFVSILGKSPKEALEIVGLDISFFLKSIGSLSAGQFQRVLIAFALIGKPMVLLFDEPTASIDMKGEETLYDLLHRLQDIHRFSLILISHDLTFVYRYADRVLCLNKEQLCFGVPEEVLTPQALEKLYGTGGKFYHHLHE